jgi:hypothetical protein
VPRDAIRLSTADERILGLADRLWERAPVPASRESSLPSALNFSIDVASAASAGGSPEPPRRAERWTVGSNDIDLAIGDELHGRIDLGRRAMVARVSDDLVTSDPSLVARLLLETPVAVLLARRAYGVLHAGAVVGPAGALVIRGAAGAGKSTLIGAAYRAGLGVLGDETVLVARHDPDELLAAVRDLTLLPDATRLLGLEAAVTPATNGHEPKHRVDLFSGSTPAQRRGRRVATVLLGDWKGGPARLERLAPEEFLRRFDEGAIPQEQWSGTPPEIAASWASGSGAYRLTGAADLAGAIRLLGGLVGLARVERPT